MYKAYFAMADPKTREIFSSIPNKFSQLLQLFMRIFHL